MHLLGSMDSNLLFSLPPTNYGVKSSFAAHRGIREVGVIVYRWNTKIQSRDRKSVV